MTTPNHRFSRRKIQRSGGRPTLRNSLTRPASTTAVTSHLPDSSRTVCTTKATCGTVCAHHYASPPSGFATSLSGIRRYSPWPTTIRATEFPAQPFGLIAHPPSPIFIRRRCCGRSTRCQRTSTFSIPRCHGLLCLHTRTTEGDAFVVLLGSRSECQVTAAPLPRLAVGWLGRICCRLSQPPGRFRHRSLVRRYTPPQ